tara:strand:- start:383 stop:619 length:237 start_codon:yes stop_codon:yes gene_type:complete
MAAVVNVSEAKAHFSNLLERVRQGEEIIVAKAGKPVARLLPLKGWAARRTPGSARGKFTMSDDFNAQLPDDLLDAFGK